MILGFIEIDLDARTIHTHRDSYLIDKLTVVSARRPFLAGGVMLGGGMAGFAAVFGDLLYPHEIALIGSVGVAALVAGLQVGQLSLLSRDLRGSELSGAVWGRYAAVNKARRDIARAVTASRQGVRS